MGRVSSTTDDRSRRWWEYSCNSSIRCKLRHSHRRTKVKITFCYILHFNTVLNCWHYVSNLAERTPWSEYRITFVTTKSKIPLACCAVQGKCIYEYVCFTTSAAIKEFTGSNFFVTGKVTYVERTFNYLYGIRCYKTVRNLLTYALMESNEANIVSTYGNEPIKRVD